MVSGMKRRTVLKRIGAAGLTTAAITGTVSATNRDTSKIWHNDGGRQVLLTDEQIANVDTTGICDFEGGECCEGVDCVCPPDCMLCCCGCT